MCLPFKSSTLVKLISCIFLSSICFSPTMSLDRDELLARISNPKGHTQEERSDYISFLALQMEKDLELVRKVSSTNINDLSDLKGIDEILGTKKIIQTLKKCNESLETVGDGCRSILKLTKKATSTVITERKIATKEKRDELIKNTKVVAKKSRSALVSPPPRKLCREAKLKSEKRLQDRKDEEKVIKLKSRGYRDVTKMHSKPRSAVAKQMRNMPKRKVSKVHCSAFGTAMIELYGGEKHELPAPIHDDILYTMRELIIELTPFSGLGIKRIVNDLRSAQRVIFSGTTFMEWYGPYASGKTRKLPKEGDLGQLSGRPNIKLTENICLDMNSDVLNNTSYVEDSVAHTMDVLFESRKRTAEESGICGDMVNTPSMCTVFSYDHFARLMDPDVKTVNRDSARAKSINREIQSRSMRTFASHVASTIVTSLIPGKWHDKPDNLPEGANLIHTAAEDAFDMHMRPIDFEQLINSDDTGRFVSEGNDAKPNKQRKRGKTAQSSTTDKTRNVSSLWRKADHSDSLCNGLKAKFKVCASASGHVAPICIHFYGLTETELSVPFLVLEVEGLTISGDVTAGCKDVGYVILTRGSADDESGVSISERVCEWYHNTVIKPFVSKLRKNGSDEVYVHDESMGTDDTKRTIFKMDSELTYLNFLRRPEVLNANHTSGIHVVKVGAASTESYQALDVSICFKELSKALADCTLKYDSSKLKATITRLLSTSAEISNRLNSSKRKAIVDAVSIAPECYRRAFTRNNSSCPV